jgi:hypothetical protein
MPGLHLYVRSGRFGPRQTQGFCASYWLEPMHSSPSDWNFIVKPVARKASPSANPLNMLRTALWGSIAAF